MATTSVVAGRDEGELGDEIKAGGDGGVEDGVSWFPAMRPGDCDGGGGREPGEGGDDVAAGIIEGCGCCGGAIGGGTDDCIVATTVNDSISTPRDAERVDSVAALSSSITRAATSLVSAMMRAVTRMLPPLTFRAIDASGTLTRMARFARYAMWLKVSTHP